MSVEHAVQPVNTDRLLAVDKYDVDPAGSHIALDDSGSDEAFDRLVRICPAGLYTWNEDGERAFDHSGCLECGSCRVCGEGIVSKWHNPGPECGVIYRFG